MTIKEKEIFCQGEVFDTETTGFIFWSGPIVSDRTSPWLPVDGQSLSLL
jgi:hypothetical protein